MAEPERTFDDSDGPRVAESFNIYQATMTMLSVFTGFVFAALLQIILPPEQLDATTKVAVRVLLAALCAFLAAIFSFHHAAHQMVRYWNIVLPRGTFVRIGAFGLIGGFMLMWFGLAVLLWGRHMDIEAAILGIASVVLGGYAAQSRRLHNPKATYLRDVDDLR